jgi:hypothetical protein
VARFDASNVAIAAEKSMSIAVAHRLSLTPSSPPRYPAPAGKAFGGGATGLAHPRSRSIAARTSRARPRQFIGQEWRRNHWRALGGSPSGNAQTFDRFPECADETRHYRGVSRVKVGRLPNYSG